MPRSKNTIPSRNKRKKVFKQAKGFFGQRKNVYTVAKNAVEKSLEYNYRDRRQKKREFRRLWNTRINAAARQDGISYSSLIKKLKDADVQLNRKVLADLAKNDPKAFSAVLEKVK
ncbi:MAG: 50S ribosomal protein L20 [Bacteroidetes bacterium SW_11_45_7]|nr:MAG: 50S ribosomal protein L20 [Bacteroidetes bacterium SW_11_45_7]